MKWIRIKDKEPPKDGKPFLGYDSTKEYNGKIYVLVFVKGRKYTSEEFEQLSSEDHYLESSGEGYFKWEPTHWMPLPELPND